MISTKPAVGRHLFSKIWIQRREKEEEPGLLYRNFLFKY